MTQKAKRRQKRRKQQEKLDRKNWAVFKTTVLGSRNPIRLPFLNQSGELVRGYLVEIPRMQEQLREDTQEDLTRFHAMERAVRATAIAFDLPQAVARFKVQDFCRANSVNPNDLFRMIRSGNIVRHPESFLVAKPVEQSWVFSANSQDGWNCAIVDALSSISVEVLSLTMERESQIAIVEIEPPPSFRVDGEHLWQRASFILGKVIGYQRDEFQRLQTIEIRLTYNIEETEYLNGDLVRRTLRIFNDSHPSHRALFPNTKENLQ